MDKQLIKHFDEYEIRFKKSIIEELLKKFKIDKQSRTAMISLDKIFEYVEPEETFMTKLSVNRHYIALGVLIGLLLGLSGVYMACRYGVTIC